MSFQLRFSRLLGGLFLFLAIQGAAWAPSHEVETDRGRVYLRVLEESGILFCFVPSGEPALTSVPDSPLWDPEFIKTYSSRVPIEELKVGASLEAGPGSQVFCFLDPVSGRLTLEVRFQGEGDASSRRVSLELLTETGPFPRQLAVRAPSMDHLYGLGEQLAHRDLGDTRLDWKGRIRHPGATPTSFLDDPIGVYGNTMTPLAGGNVGNAMFPVLHMVDTAGTDAMLFLDNPTYSQWDFTRTPWTVSFRTGEVQGALAWGAESEELRARYLSWTGRPPVPPRKAFGLWVSEYGYENWAELEDKAETLLENAFPVDGFILDLQWFGGILEGSPDSSMGRLRFDLENFPNPAKKIAELASRGLGVVVIEESYISTNLEEFQDLAAREYLVRAPREPYQPQIIDRVPWWGVGSMLDYLNPEAGEYWHRIRRRPLIEMGVMGHWTDLGEPEIFRHVMQTEKGTEYETPIYHGGKSQLEANNLFGLNWARSIFEGYARDGGARPWILARTGTSGIQRFGAALWSGDIGANWASLRSHYAAQGHMSFSGMDYFGSDVGGFFRETFQGGSSFDELYSRWFAAACLTDIPLRPHTMNLGNKHETAPDRVGDRASNLKNLRLRYRLIPYLYGAAYEAWLHGSPLVSPLAMEPDLGVANTSGTLKRVGPALLAQLVLEPGVKSVECELPTGEWYDFGTGEAVGSGTVERPALDPEGRMITPLLARAGAIVCLGSPETSEPRPERLELVVFPGPEKSSTRIYHDDGKSQSYLHGGYALTEISHNGWNSGYARLVVEPVVGEFRPQLPAQRDVVIHIAGEKRVRAKVENTPLEVTRSGGFHTFTVPAVSLDSRLVVTLD